MSIGANVSVIAAGAVLAFAVRIHADGFSVHSVGDVLMVVGVISLVMQLRALARQRELTTVQAETPATAVLVRPDGAIQAPYGQAVGAVAVPQVPLVPGEGYRHPNEYTGNEW